MSPRGILFVLSVHVVPDLGADLLGAALEVNFSVASMRETIPL